MYIGLIIFSIIALIIILIFKNTSKYDEKDEFIENNDLLNYDEDERENKYINLKELFYSKIKNGEKSYKFLSVYNQFDLMFIKSLFQSDQIPHFIENEYSSKYRPGMQIGSFRNTNIYILENDYNDALSIIEEYKINKKNNYKEKQTIRKPLEVLFGSWTVPEANTIDGIEIYYMNKNEKQNGT